MKENLLSASGIILFGRVFPLQIDRKELPAGLGGNQFLRQQLSKEDSRLARIYAFTYEGTFYNLPKPAVFLVHGNGEDIAGFVDGKGAGVGGSGLVAREFGFDDFPRTGKCPRRIIDGLVALCNGHGLHSS